MPQRIFLSYRREDASAWAGRLHDALAREFGERNIFQDVVAVRPGQNFTDAIDDALSQADVVLAVIGPNWLAPTGTDGEPRLSQADDYVRAELAATLAHSKQLVPVLVGGATMPPAGRLPADLEPLALRQAVVLQDATWHRDVEALIRSLRGETASARRRRRLVAAGVAVALAAGVLAGGAVAWLLLDDDTGRESAQTIGTEADGADSETMLQACPTPREPEWTPLGVTGNADVGDPASLHVEVLDGNARRQGSNFYIVLRAKTTNLAEGSQIHYPSYYTVSGGGKTFPADCFVVVGGQDPISPGRSSTELVGFDTTIDPADGFTLDLDNFGDFGRIELTPTG
jgi:hypothetical protein